MYVHVSIYCNTVDVCSCRIFVCVRGPAGQCSRELSARAQGDWCALEQPGCSLEHPIQDIQARGGLDAFAAEHNALQYVQLFSDSSYP